MNSASALPNPSAAFCEHQGYAYKMEGADGNNASCYFNENEKCDAWQFFRGECGVEFLKEFPCVEEGKEVYADFEKCCKGLTSYSSKKVIGGQPTCIKISPLGKIVLALKDFLDKIIGFFKPKAV